MRRLFWASLIVGAVVACVVITSELKRRFIRDWSYPELVAHLRSKGLNAEIKPRDPGETFPVYKLQVEGWPQNNPESFYEGDFLYVDRSESIADAQSSANTWREILQVQLGRKDVNDWMWLWGKVLFWGHPKRLAEIRAALPEHP